MLLIKLAGDSSVKKKSLRNKVSKLGRDLERVQKRYDRLNSPASRMTERTFGIAAPAIHLLSGRPNAMHESILARRKAIERDLKAF